MTDKAMRALQEAPLPQMIKDLGVAIAEAQFRMDQTAVEIAQLLADKKKASITIGETEYSLLELGFAPTFYQLTEATVEAKVAFSAAESQEFSIGMEAGVGIGFFAASINASYTAKFSFESSGSSSISAKFVSVPPPTVFTERLRQKNE
jgi:hypothetical protein